MTRLHLVDGTFELFRAHYSKRPPHRAPDGRDLKATTGVVASMLWLLEQESEAVTHIAIAFDNPIVNFRNDLFAGYKTDEGIEPALRSQFDDVEEAMCALGIVVWSMDRWEADDAMATGAARFRDRVDQVRILSPDKDLGQCLRGSRVVQVDRIRDKEIDEAAMTAARGIKPASIPDWLALVGDDADGIPGLQGFGEKGASALLAHWEKLENIPADPAQWKVPVRGAPVLAATLAEHREQALLYRKLATLVEDVPLKEDLEDLRWRGVPRDAFEAWCERAGALSLKNRPKRWATAA